LTQVIAPLYAHVLGKAAGLLGKGAAYSRLWPAQPLQAPWDRLLKGGAVLRHGALITSVQISVHGGTPDP
jgi:hypothetical protein